MILSTLNTNVMKNIVILTLLFNSSAALLAQNAGEKSDFLKPELVKPFKIEVPKDRLDWVMERVKNSRIPKQMPPSEGAASNWESGMDMEWLAGLKEYWINNFDWRKQEKLLNSYPLYKATVEDMEIQFYYIRGEGKNPLPLVITHGWPGSTFEFFDVIGPLTHPSRYGGKAEDAFTLIIPALPGFGFSSMPQKPVNGITTARLWNTLVTEIIGYPSYYAQGGDWGAGATILLAYQYPENVKAIHLNFFPGVPVPEKEQTDEEKAYFKAGDEFRTASMDYWRIQARKPMMPAVALNDSPLGTAAWIAEKFWSWSDNKGDLDSVISKDRLLTDIMLYIINDNGIDGSFWYYRGAMTEMKSSWPGYVKVPTMISKYPYDFAFTNAPLSVAKRGYNVVRFKSMPKGGHFAAMEQPELYVEDLREAFRSFRKS
jgi:pimeloyl-ACP methyl ester carboxylesterase